MESWVKSRAEMASRLNQGREAALLAAAEPGKTGDLQSGEEVFRAEYNRGPWFQPKKGSVFPAKKKLVKKMMVDSIAKFLSSLSISPESSLSSKIGGGCSSKMTASSSSTATPSSKSFSRKKRKEIFPDP